MILIKFYNIFTFLNTGPRELNVTPTWEGSRIQRSERGSIRIFPVLLSLLLWTLFHLYMVNEGSYSVVYDESSVLGRYILLTGN